MPKILIVDDEMGLQITLKAFLKNDGLAAHTASNALDALEMIRVHSYDVVVTDVIMPQMNGVELLDRIRDLSQDIQVIVMTGEPTVDTAVKAVESKAAFYLSKPIRKDEFIVAVKKSLEIKKNIDAKKKSDQMSSEYQHELEVVVQERTDALQRSMKSMIVLLSQVVEYRDPYTAGHQRRVGNLSAAIAKKMGLDDRLIEQLRVIGYIHDIGKITVPAEILSKPGVLTDIETQLIRTHTQVGYNMLKDSDLPPNIAIAVYEHHERINGSGYPRGIIGHSLKVESRILMVADVVEAMLSHRPYRPSMGLDAALYEIETNAGVLYDSEVVTACLELFRADHYTIDDGQHDIRMSIS